MPAAVYLLALAALYVAALPGVGPWMAPGYADWHPYHAHLRAEDAARDHPHSYDAPHRHASTSQPSARAETEDEPTTESSNSTPTMLPADGMAHGLAMVSVAFLADALHPSFKSDPDRFGAPHDDAEPDAAVVTAPKRPPRS